MTRTAKKMNIICIIPARGGSKGIPKKNILEFCGKPLIVWSIEQAKASQYIKNIYVSSDDKEILKISDGAGAKIINRPKRLSTDYSPSEEALQHAIDHIQSSEKEKINAVVFLQATSPIRTSEDIDKATELFVSKKADSLFSAIKIEDFLMWKALKNKYRSVTYDYKNRGRRQDRSPFYMEHGSIYIFKPTILEKYNNRLGSKIVVYLTDYWKSFQIDRPEDVEICEYFMRKKILKKKPEIDIKNIRLIVYDFDGVLTDNKIHLNEEGIESVTLNRSDGLAMDVLKKWRINQIILSTETNKVVEERAKKLGILAIRGVENKKETLLAYCRKNEIPVETVVYIGNDLNDLEAMKITGYPVCPSDASEEIKNISKIILDSAGGGGVVRELIKYIKFKARKKL
jgi:YrbI family 3-deoxy-D-manno-octulosonate 8-phosphate phosphatase